jgi:hypothetical protein
MIVLIVIDVRELNQVEAGARILGNQHAGADQREGLLLTQRDEEAIVSAEIAKVLLIERTERGREMRN